MSTSHGSGFSAVVTEAWNENNLIAVLLELTYRCNLDCFFCYNDLGKKGRPVPTERYLSLLEEFKEEGVLVLALSGGEPLMHPGFWEIATRASDLAFPSGSRRTGMASRRTRSSVSTGMCGPSGSRSAFTEAGRRPTTARLAFRGRSSA